MIPVAKDVSLLGGWPPFMFNVYLAGETLIDAGTRWAKSRIFRQLGRRRVSAIALTHCHPDHQGCIAVVKEKCGATLACHSADAPAMEGREPMAPDNRLLRLGVWAWAGPPTPVDRLLSDGDRLGEFRVVHAPGHTPGHVMFFRETDRLLLAGDILANINFITWEPGLREPPKKFCSAPEQNRRSLKLLLDLEPAIVCFGHGPPLTDQRMLREFIRSRLARLDTEAVAAPH